MTDSSAKLSNYRQAPRKVRLVADLVRGKRVDRALALLDVLPKRASEAIQKLIRSAVSNAKSGTAESLVISKIALNGGAVMKRHMPRARGRASLIKKKSSHITLELSSIKPIAQKPASPATVTTK